MHRDIRGAFLLITYLSTTLQLPLGAADCNQNGSEDDGDIAIAASVDCNHNSIPDECEFAPLEYFPGSDVPLPTNPWAFKVADINGDGIADLLSGNRASNLTSSVQVAFSRGDGTFDGPVEFPAGRTLVGVTAADFDGDGDNDVVATSRSVLQILENPGDGTLQMPTNIPAPSSTRSLSATDVTGDGLSDLLVLQRSGLSVLTSQGALTFAEATTLATASSTAVMCTADFDGDGDTDIALTDSLDNVLSILLGGDGSFTPSAPPDAGDAMPFWVGAWDFDLDGDVDLALASDAEISILSNRGDGSFDRQVVHTGRSTGAATDDLDHDGDADIIVVNQDVFSVFVNSGAGNFLGPLTVGTMRKTENFELADLNGDGDIDIGILTVRPNAFQFLWNGETTRLALEPRTTHIGERPHSIQTGDFNGDGVIDAATANGHAQTVTVVLGAGDGGFSLPQHYNSPHGALAGQFQTLTSGDVDGDGDLDVASSDRESDTIHLFLNDGSAVLDEVVAVRTGSGPYSSVMFDVDNDGAPELVSINQGTRSLSVHYNRGDGTLDTRQDIELPSGGRFFTPTDVDGDGDLDMAAAMSGSRQIGIVRNLGNRTFAPTTAFAVLVSLDYITTADFDGNGSHDLVTAAGEGGAVYLNQGDGTFGDGFVYEAGARLWSSSPGDLDQDGRVDLVTANGGLESGDSLTVLMGLGDGTFQEPRQFTVGSEPRFVSILDVDADGDVDIISANRRTMDLTILQNQSNFEVFPEPFLETVCTPLNFYDISLPSGLTGVDRTTRYLTSADNDPTALPTLYQNAALFVSDEEFLSTTFSDRFSGLTAEGFHQLVALRASRQYFGGAIHRLLFQDGSAYGFTVTTDPTEQLLLEEVTGVFEELRKSFQLEPFGYRPETATAREAARQWESPGFPVYLEDEVTGPTDQTYTFELVIPPQTVMCGTFGLAGVSRGLREEYEFKSRVALRGGSIKLSSDVDSVALDLFDSVVFGPEQETATPTSPGTFRLQVIPRADFTVYRYTYEQESALSGGRRLLLELVRPLDFRAAGSNVLVGSITFDEAYFTARPSQEAFVASVDGTIQTRYGSCSYESSGLWDVTFTAIDGTTVHLQKRWTEEASETETAPAALISADVQLGDTRRMVTEYWDLAYSARRHNRGVEYWVVLDPPATVAGVDGDVHVIELVAPDTDLGIEVGMTYLDANFEALASPVVSTFTKEPVRAAVLFRRGDNNADDEVNITDGIVILNYLFRTAAEPKCLKTTDWDDSGTIDLTDAVALLSFLFRDRVPAPEPFRECGIDNTADELTCESYPPCE